MELLMNRVDLVLHQQSKAQPLARRIIGPVG
jgi:hypothetical protein